MTCYAANMGSERKSAALSRIDRALERVELALLQPRGRGGSTELAELARRHDALKQESVHTLAEIDSLIAHATETVA